MMNNNTQMMNNGAEMMGWGGMWFGSFTMLAFFTIAVLGVVALIKYISTNN